MILDFQKPITDFKYLLCFDLAKFETGVSLIDIRDPHHPSVIEVYQISIDKKCKSPFGKFNEVLEDFFQSLIKDYSFKDILIVREKQPTGFNVTTTISTLQALAGVHTILDLFVYKYDFYEYQDGIHSSSVKACFRHLLNIEKPQKEDIKSYLMTKYKNDLNRYNIVTLDISDSIALAECLLLEKWNSDLKELIKSEKKHLKELKMENAKIKQQKIIDQYESRKIE